MKNNFLSALSIAVSLLTFPAVSSATEYIATTINATAPAGHHFQGHNQYSSMVTFKGNIYVFSMDGDRRPYINKINETDPNSIVTGRIDPVDGSDLLTGTYRVLDDGHQRFTIALDEEGYIHVFGDMHHGNMGTLRTASTTNPLPTRFRGSIGDQQYWISNAPESVTNGFTFVGFDAQKALPCQDLTYGHLENDNFGKLYYISRQSVKTPRSHVAGTMGLGLWRYNITSKSWDALGGIPADNYGFAEPILYPSIMWEPHGWLADDWYQTYNSSLKFDAYNRLHLLCAINSDSNVEGCTDVLYAYSDDGGDTFFRRDGTQITSFPIRVTGPVENRGSILMTQGDESFDSSYMAVFWDRNSNPAFSYKGGDGNLYYSYYDTLSQQMIAHNRSAMDGMYAPSLRANTPSLNDGSFVTFGTTRMWHQPNASDEVTGIKYQGDFNATADWEGNQYFMREVDDTLLQSKNILRGLSAKNGEGVVISIDLNPISIPGYNLWADEWGVPIGAPDSDYDADGRNNLYEYALYGDPTNPLDKGVNPVFTNGVFSHLHRNDDASLVYSLETTTNLVSGSWTNEGLPYTAVDTTIRQYDESVYDIPTENPQGFLQLKVTNP